MFNKRNLPVVLLVLACGVFVAFRSLGYKSEPPTKYEKILRDVGVMLEDVHYSPKAIDDKFSKEVFTKYLSEKVDVEKDILLKTDIEALRGKYETKIDDEILGKTPVQFEPAVFAVLKEEFLKQKRFTKTSCHILLIFRKMNPSMKITTKWIFLKPKRTEKKRGENI